MYCLGETRPLMVGIVFGQGRTPRPRCLFLARVGITSRGEDPFAATAPAPGDLAGAGWRAARQVATSGSRQKRAGGTRRLPWRAPPGRQRRDREQAVRW